MHVMLLHLVRNAMDYIAVMSNGLPEKGAAGLLTPCPFAVWSSPLCRLVQSPVRARAQITDFECSAAPSDTGACVYVY